MIRRLARQEDGYAVPLALSVILIVLGFGAVAIVLATHSVDRSTRDRLSVRALAAADAGLDAAAYRMSKMVLASEISNLLDPASLTALVQETTGCLDIGALGLLEVSWTNGVTGCGGSSEQEVDGEVGGDGTGPPASYTYWIRTGVHVLDPGSCALERNIVSVGRAEEVTRRTMGTYCLDVDAPVGDTVTRLAWVECTPAVPVPGTDPMAGC